MAEEEFQRDKKRVRASFDKAASTYDEVAVLQREIGDRLLERLDYVRLQPECVLDVGSGTGHCSSAIAKRYKKARVVSLDLAPGMLQQAQKRNSFWARTFSSQAYVCGDAEQLPLADASCELLFTNLALQWCSDLDQTFREFRRVLKPGGLLMFATFGPDTLKELRSAWAEVDSEVHVNGFIDMHDVGDAMVRSQFEGVVMDAEEITLTYDKINGLFRDLKQLGAHNVNDGRPRGLTGKARLETVTQAYEKFRQEGVLPASYEVIYGHAWVPEATPQQKKDNDGTVVVSLDQVRSSLAHTKK
ncbi:MAG: malonyl-ACP O-methyltransferase BioC [Gammaproteobacteria bacterium]|nr:malonyl-ACP O-methyltransferase BioC [Gammaproteobacteria bacterium]